MVSRGSALRSIASSSMAARDWVVDGERLSRWEAVKNEGLLREEALGLLQPFTKRGNIWLIIKARW